MGQVIHRPIAYTDRMTLGEIVRELNVALRDVSGQVTLNYFNGYPQVLATILSNVTQTIWIPQEACLVESIAVRCSSGTASVTPRIGGVAMGVTGGTPITATTTATAYAVESANQVEDLSNVDCVVASLGAGERVSVRLSVRRLQ